MGVMDGGSERSSGVSLFELLAGIEAEESEAVFDVMSEAELRRLFHHWFLWARPSQIAPDGDWRIWLLMAGRGFGKTRAGAEWVRTIAGVNKDARIALVGATMAEARAVMVEGESGLLAISPPSERPIWEPSLRRLRWANGAMATLYSAGEPESLRGPQHSHGWCDEIAKWKEGVDAWDNLMMGLRLGTRPQVLATTTPRPVTLVKRLVSEKGVEISKGATEDNRVHLPQVFLDAMDATYGGTALGRQELDGELIEELEGALWSRAMIEASRCKRDVDGTQRQMARIVIGVDPPASAHGDACGIIVVGLGADGRAYVLDDASVEKASPETWARAVADAAEGWKADRVIAEANQGGAMVRSVLQAADIGLPIKLVHASRGKIARAEPVAALYEAGRVHHAGVFPKLEDELGGLMIGGVYEGPSRSPDRADALVWALSELMLGRKGEPRIR